ncbi:hypothetical protein [Gracilinema caldarium]|uniref:Uncharacterized protein n=1 Tax=Gracilinema caldarium (strain ATCC 51460 / DSM 7334 / H1) TaxID=744872 RepID=F8F1A3_GRAC1|nr:hypothetical protein [Gracilinema caldarium]AEJ18747.1 hypothetical protein Spica_0587 [Gracilinema caldarium DSM 7334]
MKLEFLSRLYFALRRDVELAYKQVETQRLSLETKLNRLFVQQYEGASAWAEISDQSPIFFDISILAKDFRIHQIQADLDWLKTLL